jgi:hypothetical protein
VILPNPLLAQGHSDMSRKVAVPRSVLGTVGRWRGTAASQQSAARISALKDALGMLPVAVLQRTDTIEDFKWPYGETRSIAALNRTLGILPNAFNWGRGRTAPIFTASPFHRFGVKIETKVETKRDRRVNSAQVAAINCDET